MVKSTLIHHNLAKTSKISDKVKDKRIFGALIYFLFLFSAVAPALSARVVCFDMFLEVLVL